MKAEPTNSEKLLLIKRADNFLIQVTSDKNRNTFKRWAKRNYSNANDFKIEDYFDETVYRCYNIIKEGKHHSKSEIQLETKKDCNSYFFSILYKNYYRFTQQQHDNLDAHYYNLTAEDDDLTEEEKNGVLKVVMNSYDSLKAIYKEPIRLYFFENKKYEEIAEELNISLSKVKDRIHFAKQIMFKECENDVNEIKFG